MVLALSVALYGTVLILAWLVALGAVLYRLTGGLRIRISDDALVFERPVGSARVSLDAIAWRTCGAPAAPRD